MSRHVQGAGGQGADGEFLIRLEQAAELRPVLLSLAREDVRERVLHGADARTDADAPADLLLQIGRGGQMVGMGVRLQQPLHCQPAFAHEVHHAVGGRC